MRSRSRRRAAHAVAAIVVAISSMAGCGGGGDPVDPGPTTRAVTVAKSGTGAGTITSSPSGISCGTTCTASLGNSAAITLNAAAAAGSQFVDWSGACSGTAASCSIAAGTSAVSATARFDLILFSLNVTLAGTGTGTVTSSPAGISCGSDCSENIASGTSVTLTATPSASSTFTGWSGGGCSGTAPCTITMNAAAAVTATFTLVTNTLTVTRAGTGTGTVTSGPAGITCGADCTEAYNAGTVVTLTAAAGAQSVFAGWSGGGCSGTGTCVVTMNAANAVTATFTLVTNSLSVTRAGTGTGTVTSVPAGITCGADCTEAYNAGTVVTLTAAPSASSTFAGWSGGGCSGTGTCVVAMNAAISVTATFNLASFALTVSRTGTGSGTVTSTPGGINCGSDCSESYASGTVVTLTARADAASIFGGWSGATCTGTGTCDVTVNQITAVTATFAPIVPRWPDSFTRLCSDGAVAVACPGGIAGQDGAYQINVPSYVVFGGSVQDAITGLVWERAPAITGIDHATATTYCNNLTLDGFDDWRMPGYLELISIVDFGRNGPPFPTAAFPGIPQNSYFWSTASPAANAAQAISVNTNWPTSAYRLKTETSDRLIRCVRGTPISGTLQNVGGDIEDARTQLTWQSTTAATTLNWQDALGYCEGLNLNGRTDWRLPSGKELMSIVDHNQLNPTISALFATRPGTVFWSSSATPINATAYAINFSTGLSAGIETSMSQLRDVRCVR